MSIPSPTTTYQSFDNFAFSLSMDNVASENSNKKVACRLFKLDHKDYVVTLTPNNDYLVMEFPTQSDLKDKKLSIHRVNPELTKRLNDYLEKAERE